MPHSVRETYRHKHTEKIPNGQVDTHPQIEIYAQIQYVTDTATPQTERERQTDRQTADRQTPDTPLESPTQTLRHRKTETKRQTKTQTQTQTQT